MSLHKEIIKTGIIFKRPLRIFSNLFYILRAGKKSGTPMMLKFESSSVCNLKCKMCPLNNGLSRKKGFLTFQNFKKVFDEIKPPYLNLTGIGEPLLNPDIFKIISYARKKGSFVKLDTNATLLDQDNIIKLINSNPTFISVSIDGITKKTYEDIRIGSNFDKVVRNINDLVEYKNKIKSKTKIQLFFVLQKSNILDLPRFIEFAEKMNVDSANGTIVIPLGKNKNKENMKIPKKDIKIIERKINELKKKVKVRLNMEEIINFLKDTDKKDCSKKPCFWPWYQTFITWDGYITPCCMYCDNELIFGNVFEESFRDIWNNERIKNFRMKLLKNRKDLEICKNCGVDEEFMNKKFLRKKIK